MSNENLVSECCCAAPMGELDCNFWGRCSDCAEVSHFVAEKHLTGKQYIITDKDDNSAHTFYSSDAWDIGINEDGNDCVMSSPVSQTFKEMEELGHTYLDSDYYTYEIVKHNDCKS